MKSLAVIFLVTLLVIVFMAGSRANSRDDISSATCAVTSSGSGEIPVRTAYFYCTGDSYSAQLSIFIGQNHLVAVTDSFDGKGHIVSFRPMRSDEK